MENKEKVLDHLYTARWCLNQEPPKVEGAKEEITKAIGLIIGASETPPAGEERETPAPDEPAKATLAVIVGHEKRAPGASFKLGGSEYQYNSDIAGRMKDYAAVHHPGLRVEIIFRDGIGISGAYRKAASLNPDACIELHFNAFNGKASGSETLCSVNTLDKAFAGFIHNRICDVFQRGGVSRGLKVLSRSDRGGQSVYSLPGSANCLPEPFFGDHLGDATLADKKRQEYAVGLIEATLTYLKTVGLNVS